jgi:hypothetical protein
MTAVLPKTKTNGRPEIIPRVMITNMTTEEIELSMDAIFLVGLYGDRG